MTRIQSLPSPGVRRPQGGFTLTELLITIAIIVALAAVRVSAVGKMQVQGKSIGCMGNSMQMVAAICNR